MNTENKPFGKLFNSVELQSEDHLDMILQTMNKDSAFYLLIQSVKFAYLSGVYTMGEVEVLSKAIRTLSKPEPNKEEEPKEE